MSENNKTTNEKRREALERRERPTRNTLGMEKNEYEKYKQELIKKYRDGFGLTIRGIAREEQEKGIPLYADRLRRWIHKSPVRVKSKEETLRKLDNGGKSHTVYITNDQFENLNQFPNVSEMVRLGLDIVTGLPTKNIILFLGEGKNVTFMFEYDSFETYTTSDLTEFEERTIQTLINKAKIHGSEHIIKFAVENDLTYYGGQKVKHA